MTTATLPNGERVTISSEKENWWLTHKAIGYLPPDFLAPDPKQPRKAIGGGDWEDFCANIKSNGVREPIRVTPREKAPWVEVDPNNKSPFIIVSGHRRHKSACQTGLPAVPVIVMIYKDKASYEDDADILNTGRRDLTALEEAYQIQRRRNRGDNWEQIAQARGMNKLTCQLRLKLLNLAPDIKDKIDPVTRQGRRSDFPINVAQALGAIEQIQEADFPELCAQYGVSAVVEESEEENRFSFALQRAVLEYITTCEMKSTLAIEYIKNGRRKKVNTGSAAEDRSARRRKRAVLAVINTPLKSATSVWTRADFRAAFAGESASQMQEHIDKMRSAISELERLYELTEDIQRAKKESESAQPAQRFQPTPDMSLRDTDPERAKQIAANLGFPLAPKAGE